LGSSPVACDHATPTRKGQVLLVSQKRKVKLKKKIFLGSSRPNCFYTSGRLYADFIRLLFLHAHREASAMANELPEASDQFRFLRAACLANRKGLSFDFG
jgi:hypothetical protein